MNAIAESLKELLGGIRVVPDPPKSEDGEQQRREGKKALLESRGCPIKLAREVSRVDDGHSPQKTDAIRNAYSWLKLGVADKGHEVLVLSGQRGRGKSYAAAWLLSESDVHDRSRWCSSRQFVDCLHDYQASSMGAMLRSYQRARMLVMDELGHEHLDRSGFAMSALVGFLDDRIQQEKRTVITTNMSESDFKSRYGDALHDRFRAYGFWVDVKNGRSMR